jgi:hypothetical protein
MLSHHEISTLLLVQRSPAEVVALGLDIAVLRRERLVETEPLVTGGTMLRLTAKGIEVLGRLNSRFDIASDATGHTSDEDPTSDARSPNSHTRSTCQ